MNESKRLVGYCRVSTSEQEQDGVSLDAQAQRLEAYCVAHGHELVAIHQEQGSAKSLNREKLQEARRQCSDGLADGIIVAKLDRLTRSLKDVSELIENDFSEYQLVSVSEHIDTTSAAGRMMLNLITVISQWEREAIGERTKAGLSYKKSRGEKTGGQAPYGYKSEDAGTKEKPLKVLRVDETEIKIVSLIIDMWENQQMTLNQISRELLTRGYANRKGRKFAANQIKRIIDYQRTKTQPEPEKHYVYKITCNKGLHKGYEYIGVHKHKHPHRNTYMGGGVLLRHAQEQFGMDCFKKEVLHVFDTSKEAYTVESELVNNEWLARTDTYNVQLGGKVWGKGKDSLPAWKTEAIAKLKVLHEAQVAGMDTATYDLLV